MDNILLKFDDFGNKNRTQFLGDAFLTKFCNGKVNKLIENS